MTLPVYATVQQLGVFLAPAPVPDNAERLLTNASRRLDGLLMGARYETDSNGAPTEQDVIDLFREAVCLQAQYIADLDDETGANANVSSQRVGDVAVTRAISVVGIGTPRVSPEMIELLRTSRLAHAHPVVGWGW
ncbi:hypothetical protein V2S66_03265 [Streptomyces sp. V4-01]|uniref:Uncharacterized protein n=1 Tax=Actinacidiphila polyblastidii TaxID=3110430 RepID=A0ABU7P6X9_9ACTN|nr:hypothetical protein [Streptomyces sp. V4-01]